MAPIPLVHKADLLDAASSPWTVREFRPSDLEPAIRLWESWGETRSAPTLSLADLVAALNERVPAVVADLAGELIGAGFARISGQRGWIQRLVIDEQWRNRGIGRSLLDALERDLEMRGIDRMVAILPQDSWRLFEGAGWKLTGDIKYAEKDSTMIGAQERLLTMMGGTRPSEDLWSPALDASVAGRIVEQQVIQPLLHPEIADSLGLRAASALLLFGPPGTGKTTFAAAIAGRLGRPLLEWRRSPGNAASEGIARFFEHAAHLDQVVLFLDEIDGLAAARSEQAGGNSDTIELLKALSRVREQPGCIVVASTNHVGRLDSAILRPGRFDLILPVGSPDADTRLLVVEESLAAVTHSVTDVQELVDRTAGFTRADLSHLFDRACQLAFSAALGGAPAVLTPEHLRSALDRINPSVDQNAAAEFDRETQRYMRA